MLVITENTFEKTNNPKYPRGSKVSIKRNNSQVKVISNRITPYCGDITKSKRELIKTRKFIKESDKIKYHYLYARKHLCHGKYARKIKLVSVEKKKNFNHLEKFPKSRKKKYQVIARRVNYNVILKNSYIKNVPSGRNSFLVHLKGKRRKSHIKRSARKNFISVREAALEKAKDIGGRQVPSLHPLSDEFHFKVKTNHHHVTSKNVAKNQHSYDVEANSANLDGISANNSTLDMVTVVLNREKQHPNWHLNRHPTRKALFNTCSMRTLTTNSLIDSIISLSNELNKTNEKKDDSKDEYDKSVLHYVNKILSDHNFHYDIVSSVNKNEIKELKKKVKKYNDIPKFYFRKLFKYIGEKNESSRMCGNYLHTTHCYNSDCDVHYDDRDRSNSCKRGNNDYMHDEEKVKKQKDPSPSFYTYQRCHSDNYFSENLKEKKKKKKSHVYQPVNPVERANLSKQEESNYFMKRIGTGTKTTSKHLTNLKSPLNHQNVGAKGNHAKVGNASRKEGIVEKNIPVVERAVSSNQIKHGNQKKENTLLCVTSAPNNHKNNFHSDSNLLHCTKKYTPTFTDLKKHILKRQNHLNYNLEKDYPSIENTRSGKSPKIERRLRQKDLRNEKWAACIVQKKLSVHENVVMCSEKKNLQEKIYNLSNFKFSENADSSCMLSHVANASIVPSVMSSATCKLRENSLEEVPGIVTQYAPVHMNSADRIRNNEWIFNTSETRNAQSGIPSGREKKDNGNCNCGISENMYNECTFSLNNVKRNDSLINSTDANASDNVYFSADNHSNHTMNSLHSNNMQYMDNWSRSFFKSSYKKQSIISTFSSSISRHRKDRCDVAPPVGILNRGDPPQGKRSNDDNSAIPTIIPFQRSAKTKSVDADARTDSAAERDNTGDKQKIRIKSSELGINNLEGQKSLRSSVNSLSSAELIKTPVVSNIQNNHFKGIPKINENDSTSFCIFKTKHTRERPSSKTPLIVDIPNFRNTSNEIDFLAKGRKGVNIFAYNSRDKKMNNNDDHNFLVEECLKENASKFRTNEDYERYCNEDKILNPDYIPQESKKLGENFLQNHKEKFASYGNSSFHYQPYMSNAECGNSCFKQDPPGYNLYNDPNMNFMNNMKINVFNNTASQNTSNSTFNNVGIYSNCHINSINKEYYMKKGNDYSNDVFIKYYEQYANKENDKNEAKKFNYTDCYDFKNTLLNGLSREDSFGSDDDLKNEESEMNFLKDSLNSFDNLESTEKKYEEILRDFNGKIPLLHKVLKPLPVKNRSNNFDICLYLLQKHGGDLNNEENICILRDKEIVQHSAIYDAKKGCIKSNITNVTNIKLYHPKWHNKKKIVERLKEQSCFNPFTIFGSAPSLLDFDEVFDKEVYNKFVSRNSRKSHSLLRILAKQKVINNLNDKITDKEWPQVHAYLKKRWSKETNIELNWACDPLLYEELEWYLSTNNEYLNMTDKVADIEVCYCPTLDPSSYYAWNDSRVIYTNLCYNKSKEDAEPTSHSVKDKYAGNKNAELKNKDKQVSFRKRASGCEHLMFQQNLMKQKKLSKRKKKLLKKKKKMLKEKNQILKEQSRQFAANNDVNDADVGAIDMERANAADAPSSGVFYMETKEGSENDYKHVYSSQHNNTNFSNDPCMRMRINMDMGMRMSGLKSKKHNHDSAYYPNIFSTKKKKSVYHNKNYDEDVIPIMTVNTSLYRHNMDNKYNCNNTAFDYIKNKDNTIKFFASPKKTRKNNSVKKSINNSDSFYFLNSSMINSDNIYNNNLNSFDSKDSGDGNDSTCVFHKDTFDASDDKVKSKNHVDTRNNPIDSMQMDNFDNAPENLCENFRMNEHTSYISNNNIYEFGGTKNPFDFRKNDNDGNENSSGMGYYMTRDNENFSSKGGSFCYKGGGRPTNDSMQPFHMSMTDKYGNANNNVNMSIFSNIRMYEQNFNKNGGDHGDSRNSLSRDYDMDNHGGSSMGKGPFTKSNFVDRSYYDMEQTNFSSNKFSHFSTREMAQNELQYKSIFRTGLSNPNFAEQNQSQNKNETKFPIKELSERYPSKCKGGNAEYSDSHGNNGSENHHDNRNNDMISEDNCNYFECKYGNSSNKHANGKNNQMIADYFLSKNTENYDPTEEKNIIINEQYATAESQKSMNNAKVDMNALKITKQNIDKKYILEKKIKTSMSFYTNKKDTDNSTVTFNSKRLSNSNIIVNENRKIRRYTNKKCQDDNTSFEHSENDKGQGNKKGSVESPSSRTSETSMSSAFKMATSVFKKLF
ncbi:conserved Plasmodium protein, unknown function [Plasmodium knowlesi strain H]|uniref:Inner centromere protein ARK-binding domain-containing protein n=3 Tax=Plasmodium knowlesi TaxID=5850 RepID=A0A5K1VJG1_PLAKH|nr:conserved Plasmodium protein, unknown function [Plasmodium knowlesi strain H]OTN65392.1 Uncharacterized protein PKNOH_S110071100 [Plasmodium knowlesi]CAA9989332.1 conserved Plasmodium protein, unknown function [Plasmodium knowlesi strain H]SBO24895.1 conserved Plasmodium protein, unknown function [Plasmodium knowlesi strain H]SBO27940.1 conserved Plasmodium protein, unknown function [Plasmodium knowlesi strain H]VVS78806.1 conserved Plasmodium protein, unknown function [Plasmodium knowlesi |eukprot:XP_002260060.1 hypothetical protein, conserved in Plasmodium species [Plasmodium knowlesi strain H]